MKSVLCFSSLLLAFANLLAPSLVMADAATAGAPQAAFNNADYLLGYQAYLGTGNTLAAYQVAQKAVAAVPTDLAWRKRLAEVALWQNLPTISLRNWLYIAEHNNSPTAWQQVGKLAPQLDNHAAMLKWRQYQAKRHPSNSKMLIELASAYEAMGQPDKGLVALAGLKRRQASRASYEAEMQLAILTGNDALALKDLHWLNTHAGPKADWLLKAAAIHYRHGRLQQAQQLLASAQPKMPTSAVTYWRTLAELSRLTGNQELAASAYQKVYDSQQYTRSDLINLVALIQPQQPAYAARLSADAFLQFGDVASANTALYLWASQQQSQQALAFLDQLNDAQIALLKGNADFRLLRGQLYESQDHYQQALDDYAAGLAITPTGVYLLQAWVSLLLQQGQLQLLQQALVESAAVAQQEPALWDLWAAGWERLGSPTLALGWLEKRHLAQPTNQLYTLAYADGLQQLGHWHQAQALRTQVSQQSGSSHNAELAQNLLSLKLSLLPVDKRNQRLNQLVNSSRNAKGEVPVWVRDLVLSAAWASDSPDSLPAFVTQQLPVTSNAPKPAWSELTQALHNQDQPRLEALLQQHQQPLPLVDSIEAAEQLSHFDQAASLAYHNASLQPHDDALLERLRERGVSDGNRLSLSYYQERQGDLTRRPIRLDWRGQLSGNLQLNAYAQQARLQGLDGIINADLSRQRQAGVGLGGHYEYASWSLWATQVDSLTRTQGTLAKLEWTPASQLTADLEIGWRQFNDNTSLLSLLTLQNTLTASLSYRISGRDTLSFSHQHEQIEAQGGGHLGNFQVDNLGYSHRLFSGASDWLIKTGVAHARSSTTDDLPQQLASLIPTGITPSPAYLIPAGYTQYSLSLAFGENSETQYLRAWHSFWEAGLMRDTQVGTGYLYRFGLLGSLAGSDRLRLYVNGTAGAQSKGETSQSIGLDYRLYY